MATANLSSFKNHKGVDFIDAVLAPLFVAATLSLSGLGTIGLDNPVSFYLSDVLYSAAGTEITWAFVLTMVALGIAWFSNEAREWDDFSEEQAGIVAGMVLLNLFSAIVPAVSSALSSYWYVGVLMLFLNGAGYYLIAYY